METELDAASTPVPVVTALLHIAGDLTVAPEAHVHESIQVDGSLRIGRGARLDEAITCQRDVEVADEVHLRSSLDTSGSLRWGRSAEAARVSCRGAFVLDDGVARATSLVARRGVHPGPATKGGA